MKQEVQERPSDDSTLDGDVGYQPPKKKVP